MNLLSLFSTYKDDSLFDLFSIENFNNKSTRMRFWYEHAKKNINP